MQRADSLEKVLRVGKMEGKRRKGRQRMRCLDSITKSVGLNLSKLQDKRQDMVKDREACHAAVRGVAKCQTVS